MVSELLLPQNRFYPSVSQYCTVQYSAVQYSTARYKPVCPGAASQLIAGVCCCQSVSGVWRERSVRETAECTSLFCGVHSEKCTSLFCGVHSEKCTNLFCGVHSEKCTLNVVLFE